MSTLRPFFFFPAARSFPFPSKGAIVFSVLGFGALNPLVPNDFSSWADFTAGRCQRMAPRNAVFVVIVQGRLGGILLVLSSMDRRERGVCAVCIFESCS